MAVEGQLAPERQDKKVIATGFLFIIGAALAWVVLSILASLFVRAADFFLEEM